MVIGAGMGLSAFTLLCAFAFLFMAFGDPILFGSVALVILTGGASCARIFHTAMRSHASGEEVQDNHDGLDLHRLGGTFAVTGRKSLSVSADSNPSTQSVEEPIKNGAPLPIQS